jgi:hypothetical protein
MEATAWQCGAVCGPQTQPQRARSRLIELRPLRCLRRSKFGPTEYTGIATISELILTGSPVKKSVKRAGLGFEPPSRRQMKPFMENARAHQKHQHLLIGNACALIHGVQAVQKTFDFSLIEVRNRGKNRPARKVPCTNGRNHSWMVGYSYLGVISGLPVTRPVGILTTTGALIRKW